MSGPSKKRSCDGKKRHDSYAEAEQQLRALTRKDGVLTPLQMTIYACQFCKGYHLGHRSPVGRRR